MNAKLLSPGQAAQLLGVGSSTLRLWSEQFKEHLSAAAQGGSGRRRHYSADDLATLARARDMLRDGRSVADVLAGLGVVEPTTGAAIVTAENVAETTRSIIAAMRDEWNAQQAAQNATIATLTDEVTALRAEVEALKTTRRGWWQRLRGG